MRKPMTFKALAATAALISSYLIPLEECISISSLIAFKESDVLTHSLLDGAGAVGKSTRVVDLRADEAGWALLLVATDAIAQWRGAFVELDEVTASHATNIDMRTIDGIVQIPRRARTGGT